MTVTVPSPVLHAFEAADRLAGERFPYRFGGGHNQLFAPSAGPLGEHGGYDCSGWCSVILHDAGILGTAFPLNTHGFETWGHPGEGAFMTLWVINQREREHCFLEFKIPGHLRTKRFSQAAHTGTICGWSQFMETAGYTPRSRP